jgi:hypothetical protein
MLRSKGSAAPAKTMRHHVLDELVRSRDVATTLDQGGVFFERELVPIDFTSTSADAFATAMRIAERWGSEVVLFHAAGADDNDEFLNYLGGQPWGTRDVVARRGCASMPCATTIQSVRSFRRARATSPRWSFSARTRPGGLTCSARPPSASSGR